MKRSGCAVLMITLAYTLSLAHAQTPPSMLGPAAPSQTPRIATLNFNAAVLGTAEAQRSLAALQKKYSPRAQQLQTLDDDIEASKKTLNDSGSKLSEIEKNQRLQELSAKEKHLQREEEDFKNESDSESQQTLQQIAQKVFSFLQQYSQQHGYEAVLERGTDTAPIVWYAAKDIDITDQVIKGYDARVAPGASSLPNEPAATQPAPKTP